MYAQVDINEKTLEVMKSIFSRCTSDQQETFLDLINACTKNELKMKLECQQNIILSLMDDRSELSIKNRDLQREIIELKETSTPSQATKVEMHRELQRGETSRDPYPKRGAQERVYDDTPENNGGDKKEEGSEDGSEEVAQRDDLFSQKIDGDFKGLNIAVSGNYKNITRALLEEFITEL